MRFKHLPVDAGRQTDKALEVVGEVALVGKACQKSRLRIRDALLRQLTGLSDADAFQIAIGGNALLQGEGPQQGGLAAARAAAQLVKPDALGVVRFHEPAYLCDLLAAYRGVGGEGTRIAPEQDGEQQKQELIAGMSHNLKSPLTAIRAYTEGLLEGVAQDEAARQRYLQTIYAKEADMETLVNRLFAFARMDVSQYPVHAEPLALAAELEAITEEQEGVAVTVDVPEMTVLADRELLRRIAVYLLDNSRKYGGREDVSVRITAEKTGDMAAIAFTDNGAGVQPEQLPRLFDVFYRGDAARTAPGKGSGIGLAVVKKACDEMHGTVRAENAENGGLRVTVSALVNRW